MNRFLWMIGAGLMLAACAHLDGASARSDTLAPSIAATDMGTEQAVLDVLNTQTDAWNRGDIPAFMEHYWKDEQLRFGSGGTIARGWQATLDRYLRTYATREQMGQLEFSELDVHPLADDAAVVHGRWKLTRKADTPSGLFTLIFRDFGAGWVIVSDTTTSGQ